MPTPMEKRALALAEEISLFAKPRMWSLQIPGLARMLCTFAENELRLAPTVTRQRIYPMNFESHDCLMAGAIVAACLTLYAVSRWLYYDRRQRGIQAEFNGLSPDRDYGRVRERNNTIRLSTLPELKERELQAQRLQAPANTEPDPARHGAAQLEASQSPAGVVPSQSGDSGQLLTNLVPFERGYAFNFSRRIR